MRKCSIRGRSFTAAGVVPPHAVVHVKVVNVGGFLCEPKVILIAVAVVVVGDSQCRKCRQLLVHGNWSLLSLCHAAHFHPEPVLAPLFQRVERERLTTLAGREVSCGIVVMGAAVVVLQDVTGLAAWWLLTLLALPLQFVHRNQEVVQDRVWPVVAFVACRWMVRGGFPKL